MGWLARLLSPARRPEASASPASKSSPAVAAPAAAAVPPPAVPLLLPRLLGKSEATGAELSTAERRAIDAIDGALAQPALPPDLLPRAASVIPQLLALMRQSDLPVPALVQRIAKDVLLSAEVLRLASSPYYRSQGAVGDLGQAIVLIGESGLQSVIAKVVLKPIYEASAGGLSARAAQPLWEFSEATADSASHEAQAAGLAAFDGYLAGLLHGAGWTATLRLIDRAGAELPGPLSSAFAAACEERAHRLFGRTAERWNITPAFRAFAADACLHRLANSRDPLAAVLRRALEAGPAETADPVQ